MHAQLPTTRPAATSRRRIARRIACGVAVVSAALGVAAPSGAWPGSPSVILNGRVQCPAYGGPFDTVEWMWMAPSYSRAGWATRASGYVQSYSFKLDSVPFGRPDWIDVKYGCSATGQHETWIPVSRPTIGSYTTRNIY